VLEGSAAPAQDPTSTVEIVEVGHGAGETWVWRSAEVPKTVVVFLHGRGDLTPAAYNAWFGYLALRDTAVIFPRYRESAGGPSSETLASLRAGIANGWANLRSGNYGRFGGIGPATFHGAPLIVAGFGDGAALAFTVALEARRWRLETPFAVDSIFPDFARIPGPPLATLPRSTRVLIQVTPRDPAVLASGEALRHALRSRPRTGLAQLSAKALSVGHAEPRQTTAAEDAFWPPLDNFIAAASGL
jgi:hypothetical protein